MKTVLAIAHTSGTTAKTSSETITGINPEKLNVGITVSGSGHAFANFDDHKISVILKSDIGEPSRVLIDQVRVSDLLKTQDYRSAESAKAKGDANGLYPFTLLLGNYNLLGDDKMTIVLTTPGHATAVYDYRMLLIDELETAEDFFNYDSIAGNGADQIFKDCVALFLTSAPAGNTYTVNVAGSMHQITDYDAKVEAVVNGSLNSAEDFGVIWKDDLLIGEDVHVRIPAGVNFLVVRKSYYEDRLSKQDSVDYTVEQRFQKILQQKPGQAQVLMNQGRM